MVAVVEEVAVAAPTDPAAPAAVPTGLSTAWAVDSKHTGCYTGGKVVWSEALSCFGCLFSEELQLVDGASEAPSRRVAYESDAIQTFAIDSAGLNVCSSHRSGLLRHFRLGEVGAGAAAEPVLMRSWRAHEQVVADVCFDSMNAFVATGSVDRTAKVWDFAGYFCTHNFQGHNGIVSIVRFHPARLQLLTAAGTEARLWDLQTSACVGVMKDHLADISAMAVARVKGGPHRLVTAGHDQVLNLWRLEPKCPHERSIAVFESLEGVALVLTRRLAQACAQEGGRKGQFAEWLRTEGSSLPPYAVFTVGDKAQLKAWSPSDGKCVHTEASPHAAGGAFRQVLCITQGETQKLVTVGVDMNFVIWSLPNLQVINYIMGHNDEIVHVQLIPRVEWPSKADGGEAKPTRPSVTADRFVCITNDEHPRIVSCKGFSASLLRGHTDNVIACDVSPDGRWIATGGKDQSIRVWDASTCRGVCCLNGHTSAVSALSFPKKLPKAKHSAAAGGGAQPLWVVSGSQDKTMKIWELPSAGALEQAAEEVRLEKSKVTIIAHAKEVNDVTVSPNNKLIASGGHDKVVRVWSFPEGDLRGECKGHRRGIWCVAFSPIDQVIASASGDATVRLWNLKDFMPIRAFEGHASAVLRVCFLPNGMQMMTSGLDGLLKLWQIRTADCAATMEEHTGKVWCVDIVGERMVSGGSDSKLCVWRDATLEQAQVQHDAQAEVIMKDSKIGLLVQEGRIEDALSMALDLNRPGRMKQILVNHAMDVVAKSIASSEAGADKLGEGGGDLGTLDALESSSSADLQRWVRSLGGAQLERFVGFLEQWNSNRRMASIAQMFLGLLLRALPPPRLMAIEGMNAICNNILSYSDRHMARVESLLQKTFVLDLVLQPTTPS